MNSVLPTIPFGIVACTFSDNLSLNSYIWNFKLATCKEWELAVPRFSLLTIVRVTFPRQPNFPRRLFVLSSISCKYSFGKTNRMIPLNISLVKHDNPSLASRNTDKKSPSWISSHIFQIWRVHAGHLHVEQFVSKISSFAVLNINIVKNRRVILPLKL